MPFVNKVVKGVSEYDIRDTRIPNVTPEDEGKAVVVDAVGGLELKAIGGGGTQLYKHEVSISLDYTYNEIDYADKTLSYTLISDSSRDLTGAYDFFYTCKALTSQVSTPIEGTFCILTSGCYQLTNYSQMLSVRNLNGFCPFMRTVVSVSHPGGPVTIQTIAADKISLETGEVIQGENLLSNVHNVVLSDTVTAL